MQNENLPLVEEFNQLLQLSKIEPQHLQTLSQEKQLEFRKMLSGMLATLKGEERDAFIQKIESLVEPDKIWESNHIAITAAIHEHMVKYGVLPTKVHLADVCGLSRQTIHKHLQTFSSNPGYAIRTEVFSLMSHQVLSKVLQNALNGDVAASKLYLQTINKQHITETNDIVINNQNNYIQINGLVLNQQIIARLKPEQLKQIEEIIRPSIEK